jgi:two-component system, OmpR family, sensor histidine kinase CreC
MKSGMRQVFSIARKRLARTPLTLRLFALYAVLLIAAGVIATRQVIDYVKPAVRQSTEETLVDTANLLAELVREDIRRGTLEQSDLSEVLHRFEARRPGAQIWGINKNRVHHRIYVVDRHGRVLVDSTGRDVGKDYSRWNDVYFTLRGQYGARTTKDDPNDELSTVMYVAAPVYENGQIIGAVTVAKPNRTVEPFIRQASQRLGRLGAMATLVGLAVGATLSIWLSRKIRRLTDFANAVAQGKRTEVPSLPGTELRHLAESLESMRQELEGKGYVEHYVHTLTHELKSPLSAIVGATELLQEGPRSERDVRLLANIHTETSRLRSLTERLLGLAELEHRQSLEELVKIPLGPLWLEIQASLEAKGETGSVQIVSEIPEGATVWGERFLIGQALHNLVDNALDFTPSGGRVTVRAIEEAANLVLSVENEGSGIPDYAVSRVTERFYSLPRPTTGRKSTGLGLSFVQEVASLHGGSFRIYNVSEGVLAELTLPRAPN